MKAIHAVYENGIFRPTEAVDLPEGSKVRIVPDEVHNGEEAANLVRSSGQEWPCRAGSYRKAEFWMAPDFDAPLEEFEEYME